MNERIKELWNLSRNPSGRGHNEEKFAELIVRECGILADQYNFEKNQGTINPLKTTAYEFIKEHFGVRE